MKYKTIQGFKSLNKNIHARLLPDDLLSDVSNVIFEDGKVKIRWGYGDLGDNLPLSSPITAVAEYRQLRGDSKTKIALSGTDAYQYNTVSGDWDTINPRYTTGTVTWPTIAARSEFVAIFLGSHVTCEVDTNKIAVAYVNTATHVGYCRIATIDANGAYTWGVVDDFAANVAAVKICSHDTDKITVLYHSRGAPGEVYGIANTISGTTLGAWGGALATGQFGSYFDICSPSTNTVAVGLTDFYDSERGVCRASSVAGTTLSWGTVSYFTATGGHVARDLSICSPLEDKIAVAFTGNSREGICRATTVSGTTLAAWGAADEFEDSKTIYHTSICSPAEDKIAIAYNEDGSGDHKGWCIVNTLSDKTLETWGTASEFVGDSLDSVSICSQNDDKIAIVYVADTGDDLYSTVNTISETTLGTWGLTYDHTTSIESDGGVICSYDTEKVSIAYHDDVGLDAHGYGVSINYKVEGSGVTWAGAWPDNAYSIKFGTDVLEGTGTPDIWFVIADFIDTDTLYLAAYPAVQQSGVVYIINQPFTSGATDYFDFCNTIEDLTAQNEWLLVTNGIELPLYYDSTTGWFQVLAGGAPYAKYCINFYGHLLLGWCISGGNNLPQSVYWSARGEPEDWSSDSSSFIDLLDNDDEITGMEVLKQRLYVFKENSIVEGQPTGLTDPAFNFIENKIKIGAPTGRTIVNTGELIIFLGRDNVYSFNGFQALPIGTPIIDDLLANLNTDYEYKSVAVQIPTKNLYLLLITSLGATNPNRGYVFDYLRATWTIWEFANTMTALTITDDNTVLFGDSDGYVYEMDFTDTDDNGTDIDVTIITKDYAFNEYHRAVKMLQTILAMEDSSGFMEISCSIDFGDNYSDPVRFNQDTENTIHEHVQNWFQRGEQFRFKIENIDGASFALEGITIGTEDAGLSFGR
jgi:hypothetical protein